MRRKLAYSNPVLANAIAKLGSSRKVTGMSARQAGNSSWATPTGIKASIWTKRRTPRIPFERDPSMLVQVQDGTTCRDIAIESKPAYDIYVVGGGLPGFFTAQTAPY